MPADIVGRARFTVELGPGYEYNALNPITIGFHGGCLYLLSLGMLFLSRRNFVPKSITILGVILGLWVLILGASRGPALSATIGTILILFTHFWFFKKTKVNVLINLLASGIVGVATYIFVLPKLVEIDFTLLRRITSSLDKITQGEKEVRSYQWESAINQFLDSPIIGDRYLERYMNFYPHNVYLEVPMSTGIMGALIFYTMLGFALYYAFRLFVNRDELIILFIPLFAILMWMLTSGSIFEGVALWAYLALWISVNTALNRSEKETLRLQKSELV